jgi:hypothetical protein
MAAPFQKREKDERISDVIRTFYQAKIDFDAQVQTFRETSVMDYTTLHRFVEDRVYGLKEECHFLFRQVERSDAEQIQPEELFDLLIGSIFHELMKIKECAYQLSHYAPTYRQMSRARRGVEMPAYEETFLKSCVKLIRRARRSIQTEIVSAQELFRDACEHLEQMIPNYQTNRVLIRMLIENHKLVAQATGEEAVDRLLNKMFHDRLDEAYLAAARDFLDGGWFPRAQSAAERAKEIHPENPDADEILQKLEKARAAHRTTG